MNFARTTTNIRLFLAISFSLLTVFGSGSVAVGNLFLAPKGIASLNDAGTGIARLDMRAVESSQFARFRKALEARGVEVIETRLGTGKMAQTYKTSRGVVQLFIDPRKTRYIDVLHEWRHIRQFEQSMLTLQAFPNSYLRYMEKGLEAGALRYEHRLASILARREGKMLSRTYDLNTIETARVLHSQYMNKLIKSPMFRMIDILFPFK